MSTADEGLQHAGTTRPCQVCGETASAVWHGQTPLWICLKCAAYVFPRLLVDAIAQHRLAGKQYTSSLFHYWRDVELEFWKGALLTFNRFTDK